MRDKITKFCFVFWKIIISLVLQILKISTIDLTCFEYDSETSEDLVLWHIKHCRVFSAKSILYI